MSRHNHYIPETQELPAPAEIHPTARPRYVKLLEELDRRETAIRGLFSVRSTARGHWRELTGDIGTMEYQIGETRDSLDKFITSYIQWLAQQSDGWTPEREATESIARERTVKQDTVVAERRTVKQDTQPQQRNAGYSIAPRRNRVRV